MPIINKYQISRYREVIIDVPAGTVEDGGFSTFELNTPDSNPVGTGDFLGVIKKVVLLGEVVQNTLDTGNLNFFQFNNLTQAEFDALLANPNNPNRLRLNPQTGGNPVVIGWVEIGRTRPSFYYEDCVIQQNGLDGKFPKSDNYYIIENFQLGINTVSGQGQGQAAIQPIGNWNYGQAFNNWGVSPFPNQDPMDFASYVMSAARNGQVQGGVITTIPRRQPAIGNIPLLLATREEHFDSLTNTYTLTPSYSDKRDQNGNLVEKVVYGRLRGSGFGIKSLALPTNAGECGPTGTFTGPRTPSDEEDVVDITDFEEEQLGDDSLYDKLLPFDPCGDDAKIFNTPPYDSISPEEQNSFSSKFISNNLIKDPGDGTGFDINEMLPADNDEREMDIHRKIYQSLEVFSNIRDPREFTGENYDIPAGMVYALYNTQTCTYDLYPALRDKDGDIPEPIGPVLSYYFDRTRKNMIERFGVLDSPLKTLGTGSDGYYRYSDGNSYVELLGEAVFGCGDPLSFGLDIPEVVVQISDNYKSSYGKPQTINSYLADISYGIPSGVTQIRTENQRVGTQVRNLPEQWQKTIHPIYDSIFGSNSEIDYNEIDNAISIEVTGSIDTIYNNTKRPGVTWDWLLSRGYGQFSIGISYKFGVGNGEPGYVTKYKIDIIGFAKFLAGIAAIAVDWIASVFGQDVKPIISVEERRLGRSPRRVHKKGNLVLVSKSGLYSTTRNPCEQIFLGFADDYYNVPPNGRRSFIEKLSKTDVTGSLIVRKNSRNSPSNLLASSPGSSKTDIVPALFPRIKKYGRNPLLDIFYLNVITPGIKYGGDGTSSNRYSNERRFSHPSRIPFRRSSGTSESNWGDLKYGQFPSMFPQNWNAIWINDGDDRLTDESNEISYGDTFWSSRVKNTILNLKDRWTLYIDYVNGEYDKPVAVLQDKTRILDLYFGLMELHVKGVSWKEILEYVDLAVSAVSGTKYSERIDTDKLETLWKIVYNRLNEIQEKGSPNENEFYVGSYDFGEVVMIERDQNVSSVLQNLSKMYKTDLLIQNRGNSNIRIQYINIRSSDDVVDVYGRTASDYFFINDPISNQWNIGNPPELIPPVSSKKSNTTFYEIPIYFIPYMAQPEFEYSANVVVGVNVGENEVVEYRGLITGKCITDTITDSIDESLTEPLILPDSVEFGYTEINVRSSESNRTISYANRSYHEDVILKSFEIKDQMIYNTDGTNGMEMNAEKPFKFQITTTRGVSPVSTDISSGNLEINKTLKSLKNEEVPTPSVIKVSFVPKESDRVYTANLVVNYEVFGRTNEENKKFTRTIQLTGVSV